jgi:hypothetical protein
VKDPIVPAASSYVSSHKFYLHEYVTSAQTHQLGNMMSTVNVHAISEDFESISGTVVSIVFSFGYAVFKIEPLLIRRCHAT